MLGWGRGVYYRMCKGVVVSVKHSEYKCVNGAGRDKRSDTVDGVHYIQAKHVFSPRIWHGFFGRVGGCSVGTYSSLNCGLYTQDDAEKVAQNVRIVIKAVNESCGFCAFDVVKMLHQVHSDVVLHIKNSGQDTKFVEADAMITTVQGVLLAVQTADCVPILLCDCDCTVVAAIHAGWRSATSGIIQNTIAKIFELQKISQQQKVMAIIGPAIHADHSSFSLSFSDAVTDDSRCSSDRLLLVSRSVSTPCDFRY